jgi:hypothetical protein
MSSRFRERDGIREKQAWSGRPAGEDTPRIDTMRKYAHRHNGKAIRSGGAGAAEGRGYALVGSVSMRWRRGERRGGEVLVEVFKSRYGHIGGLFIYTGNASACQKDHQVRVNEREM